MMTTTKRLSNKSRYMDNTLFLKHIRLLPLELEVFATSVSQDTTTTSGNASTTENNFQRTKP